MPAPSFADLVPFEVGAPFPAFVVPSVVDGTPVAASQLRGSKVLLHLFASW